MAMLDRYRKPGGFVQLLTVIETCIPSKQEKFLELVRAEDSRWADEIKIKMIDIDRVYSWSNEILAEIFGTLPDITVAFALHAATPANRDRIMAFFSKGRKHKLDELIGVKPPTANEVVSSHLKVIETVRQMVLEGKVRFENFDPSLDLEDDIEERLSKASLPSNDPGNLFMAEPVLTPELVRPPTSAADINESRINEIQMLKKRVTELAKENATLRHELNLSRGKLEQIRKIA